MLRRGHIIRPTPNMRIMVAMNVEGRCEVHIAHKTTSLGSSLTVPEEALLELEKEISKS